MESLFKRRLPVGAETLKNSGVHFRVWAPRRARVTLLLTEGPGANPSEAEICRWPLEREENGFFSILVSGAAAGTRYCYQLDNEPDLFPDPASRYQPEGTHESSQVIDPDQFRWTDTAWKGLYLKGQVLYEMHIGTFTPEGTWLAAARELQKLSEIGITVLEIMPVFEFPGNFGWGYDGVDIFAPTHLYGTPDDFRQFVDAAHAAGLGVILDVVYNHLGPEGNYMDQFCGCFFSDKYKNEWGQAINFDGPESGPLREIFIANARYWVSEFHLDGYRLDATQQVFDASPEHILKAICREARRSAHGKSILLIAENEPQKAELVRSPAGGGLGLDALWNDDFHHTSVVALTGRKEAYYKDYNGSPQEFISAAKYGFLYQGQFYSWQKKRRGSSTQGIPPFAFINYLENHDQIANSMYGMRLHQLTGPGAYRAMMGLMLLLPGTPLLFQGQEYSASSPFLYFSEMPPQLASLVLKGRTQFLAQFPSIGTDQGLKMLAHPSDPTTFVHCKLNPADRILESRACLLCRDLLRIRREDPVIRTQGESGLDGAVIAPQAFALRFWGPEMNDRLLLVNLGTQLHFEYIPEPLLALPEGRAWEILWSSEDVRYGGNGTPKVENESSWDIPGYASLLLLSGVRPATGDVMGDR